MNGRRGFIRQFGILGAVIGGMASADTIRGGGQLLNSASGAKNFNGIGNNSKFDDSHLQPVGDTVFTLHADNKPKNDFSQSTGISSFSTGSRDKTYLVTSNVCDYTNKVSLSVGKDNRLWVEIDGKWRKVALEG